MQARPARINRTQQTPASLFKVADRAEPGIKCGTLSTSRTIVCFSHKKSIYTNGTRENITRLIVCMQYEVEEYCDIIFLNII